MMNEIQTGIVAGTIGFTGLLAALFNVEPLVFGATVFFAFLGVFAFKPVSFANGLVSAVLASVSCLLVVPIALIGFSSYPQAAVAGIFTLIVTLSSKELISILKKRPAMLLNKAFTALENYVDSLGKEDSNTKGDKE